MKNQQDEPVINLTPLIDVVFVILIMFIVVAPLIEIDRIELASKKDSGALHQGLDPIRIHVFSDDSLAYNSHSVSFDELQSCLKNDKMKFPEAKPQLFQDKKATFGTYQSIKNLVEDIGFSEMDVILEAE